jgi:hypothetical protein
MGSVPRINYLLANVFYLLLYRSNLWNKSYKIKEWSIKQTRTVKQIQ